MNGSALEDSTGASACNPFDAVVVGAGFGGLCMLQRLRSSGFSCRVFEAGGGIGGTWFWNCYPGARCDVESLQYSYQFDEDLQQQWHWTERYASQPEILRYIEHVADRFDLRRDVELNTRVVSAHWDEPRELWCIRTSSGSVWARFCVMASGCLSTTYVPDVRGSGSFAGETYHTGSWPKSRVSFRGKRVGVIGTGSSGVQIIPLIAGEAAHLYVYQRTPGFVVPARNAPMNPQHEATIKASYRAFRTANWDRYGGADYGQSATASRGLSEAERERELEARWQSGGLAFGFAFSDLGSSATAKHAAAEFVRQKIRQIVRDPLTAESLCPTIAFGCKRLIAGTNYYETFNRPNVTLVDLRKEPLESLIATGMATRSREYELDVIVFATGYDAMTGTLFNIDIRGRGGIELKQRWGDGPRTYLGLMTTAFPNLFTMTGPGSPSVISNVVASLEQHANWISDCMNYMREHGCSTIEAESTAEEAWGDEVRRLAEPTLTAGCNSWYLGSNVPGKPRVFMAHLNLPSYVRTCAEVARSGYRGFHLNRAQTRTREV